MNRKRRGKITEKSRLILGPYRLAPVVIYERHDRIYVVPDRWALPGGGAISYAEATEIARRNAWPRPRVGGSDV